MSVVTPVWPAMARGKAVAAGAVAARAAGRVSPARAPALPARKCRRFIARAPGAGWRKGKPVRW
ncbi:hypothetical protein YWS52_01010 [Chitiniphilus shinanonensis]